MTKEEYIKKYPNAEIEDKQLALDRQNHKRGKKYKEIYNIEKANDIIKRKSKALTKYKLIEKKCKLCDKVFIKKENSEQKYCSTICKFAGLKKEKKEFKCKECGNKIIDYIISNRQFCSHRCADKFNSDISRINAICCNCGKYVNKKLNQIKSGNIFCSKECKKNYKRIKLKQNYKLKAFAVYGKICSRCNSLKNIVVHHKDGNRLNNDIENLDIMCRSCHSKLHKETQHLQRNFIGEKNIERGMIQILFGLNKAFGLDISNENFRLTPKRVARAYYEIFKGINAKDELKDIAETSFPSDYDGMIIVEDIRCFSMCPHHFLPVEYIVNVGYIPGKKTVGISKLSRIVELLAKTPELQEMFTMKIKDILEKELKPKGVIVQVKGRHMCMAMRGVKQINSWTSTSSITGVFKKDKATRDEFMLMVNKHD